jgi:hypothetical protein
MSFWKAVRDIDKSLEETFEKNADKAVNDPDDGKQAWQDAQKAGEDAENTASDAASDEIKNHDPAWKAVKDLSDKAIAAESKAVETNHEARLAQVRGGRDGDLYRCNFLRFHARRTFCRNESGTRNYSTFRSGS